MSTKYANGQESIPYQALEDKNQARLGGNQVLVENLSLKEEIQRLRSSLEEAEELILASKGYLDSQVIPRPENELVFKHDSEDCAYSLLVEKTNEGTANLTFDGTILYCNPLFTEHLKGSTILGLGATLESEVGFFELDREWCFTYINQYSSRKGNFEPEELIGECIWEKFPYLINSKFEEVYKKVMETRLPAHFEIRSLIQDKCYWISVYPTGSGISVFWRDIKESKCAEEALKKANETLEEKVRQRTLELETAYNSLKESEQRLSDAQRIAHVGSWEWNIATNELYWTPEVYRIFELDPGEFEPSHIAFLNCVHPEDREYLNHAIKEALNKKPYDIDYRIILPDVTERVVQSQGEVIFDEKNTPILVRGMIQDITERKRAEEALANVEIARKQEVHHRIKNNLQVISSLLDLEAQKFKNRECISNSEVLEAFRESQDRVISMALVHEKLQKNGKIDRLEFSSYIEELVDNLFLTYKLGNAGTSLYTDLEEKIFLNMDTSVPLGMIINELVSNSLKHAFKGREEGKILIELHSEERIECKSKGLSTAFVLTVSDNGIGVPEDLNIENLDSLGLQLVASLVDQLNGELELKRDNGTEFSLKFTVVQN